MIENRQLAALDHPSRNILLSSRWQMPTQAMDAVRSLRQRQAPRPDARLPRPTLAAPPIEANGV
jgi:hypothetical protein